MRPVLGLAVAHFVANMVLLSQGYAWLGIPESRAVNLVGSVFFALLILMATSITYGASLAFFGQEKNRRVSIAWTAAIRNILPLCAAVIAIVLVYWLLTLCQEYSANPAFTVASFLTMTFRKPVAPATVAKIFNGASDVIGWAVLPVMLLPMLAAIAARGWRGFAGIDFSRWWRWLVTPALLLTAFWAPLAILDWKPHMGSFATEMFSFTVRATVAYLLFGIGWLALAFVTWAGKPRFTQSKTAVSP
jgi:hypothetical protein